LEKVSERNEKLNFVDPKYLFNVALNNFFQFFKYLKGKNPCPDETKENVYFYDSGLLHCFCDCAGALL
jgi:hypothetical protein